MSVLKFFNSLFTSNLDKSTVPMDIVPVSSNASIVQSSSKNISDMNSEISDTKPENSPPPRRSIYDIPKNKSRKNVLTRELNPIYIDTANDDVKISLRATLTVSGVIAPSESEVQSCLDDISHYFQPLDVSNQTSIQCETSVIEFPSIIATDPEFSGLISSSPLSYQQLIKALRNKIRLLRKEKKSTQEYLKSLKNSIYIHDLAQELALKGKYFESEFTIVQSKFVLGENSFNIFKSISGNFDQMGFELFPSFLKTDVKWLIEYHGTPSTHSSPHVVCKKLKSVLLQSYFEKELESRRRYNTALTLKGLVSKEIAMYLGYHKSWYQRVRGRVNFESQSIPYLEEVMKVTTGNFIVADFETTGLNCDIDEIIEIGALLCDSSGHIISKFETLVNPGIEVSSFIEELTGITNQKLESDGTTITSALIDFKKFIGTMPLFFHNSDFDAGFLRCACDDYDVPIENPIYDTLAVSRITWKKLPSHSLSNLCKYLGLMPSVHRALGDAEAARKVLLAARAVFYEQNQLK
jgi:DNA polymerase III epsilon subunit family exonuclease